MTDELIYHYTDLNGLLGILESKELWATDVRYLNDASEATFGEERLRKLVALIPRVDFPDLRLSTYSDKCGRTLVLTRPGRSWPASARAGTC